MSFARDRPIFDEMNTSTVCMQHTSQCRRHEAKWPRESIRRRRLSFVTGYTRRRTAPSTFARPFGGCALYAVDLKSVCFFFPKTTIKQTNDQNRYINDIILKAHRVAYIPVCMETLTTLQCRARGIHTHTYTEYTWTEPYLDSTCHAFCHHRPCRE